MAVTVLMQGTTLGVCIGAAALRDEDPGGLNLGTAEAANARAERSMATRFAEHRRLVSRCKCVCPAIRSGRLRLRWRARSGIIVSVRKASSVPRSGAKTFPVRA